jgi:hypothetical protein
MRSITGSLKQKGGGASSPSLKPGVSAPVEDEEIYSRGLVKLRAPHVLPELDGLRGLNNEGAESV